MGSRTQSVSPIQFAILLILLTSNLYVKTHTAKGRGISITPQPVPRNTDSVPLQIMQGCIGMGTWDTIAEFKDILVQNSEDQTLFQPQLTNDLEGWQKGSSGDWIGENGILRQNSRSINCRIISGDNTWTNYTYSLKARCTEGTEGFLIIFAAEDNNTLYWWNIAGWGNTRTAIEKITRGSKREIPGTAVDLRIETGTWYDIKIAIYGNTAECYFNGKLITKITQDKGSSTLPDAGPPTVVNNGNGPELVRSTGRVTPGLANGSRPSIRLPDGPVPTPDDIINKVLIQTTPVQSTEAIKVESILHGGIGIGTWNTKAQFRDILVQTSDKILLKPDFTRNLDGWQSNGGDWNAANGFLNQNSRSTNSQIFYGNNTWNNYTYNLKACRTEGNEGFLIIFAAQDSKNLYWWNIGGWNNTRTAIEKMTRGSKTEIRGTAVNLKIETGTWYDIKIALHGDSVDCYFNDRLITTIKDDIGKSTLPDAGPPVNGTSPQTPDSMPNGMNRNNIGTPENTITRTWKSPNSKYILKVDEITVISGYGDGPNGPMVFRRTTTNVTMTTIIGDGTTSEKCEWSSSQEQFRTTFSVANALAGDSGKLFVLIRNENGNNPITPSGEIFMPPAVILLDDNGKIHAAVTAESWWRALGQDGKVNINTPPKLSLLEDEKILKITLTSGKTVFVNTNSGEITKAELP